MKVNIQYRGGRVREVSVRDAKILVGLKKATYFADPPQAESVESAPATVGAGIGNDSVPGASVQEVGDAPVTRDLRADIEVTTETAPPARRKYQRRDLQAEDTKKVRKQRTGKKFGA